MRVLVVDDSAFMRKAITQMLRSDPRIEVVGVARNGREALDAVRTHEPDVVTLDVEMPEMDGLTALRLIKRESRARVIMLSSLTTEGSHAALRAMNIGADDVMAKDTSQVSLSITRIQDELVARVRALASAPHGMRHARRPADAPDTAPPVFDASMFDLICIGSSTGGPPVLETLARALPPTLRTPVVIAQHMPAVFTASMAERLDGMCALPVRHVDDGMPVDRSTVYVAPGGRHTHIRRVGFRAWRFGVTDQPRDALYRPSVDALLGSAAETVGARTLAVILTGMGADGFEGAKRLHALGGHIIAQSAETCVVYGMPKAVTENGLAGASLDPPRIGAVLASAARSRSAA